jgi:hypothetical protein
MSDRVIDGTWSPAGPDVPLPTPGAAWPPVSPARRRCGRVLVTLGLLSAVGVVLARINPGRFLEVVRLGLEGRPERVILPLAGAMLLIGAGVAIGARHRAAVNVGTALPMALAVLVMAAWFPLSRYEASIRPDRDAGVVDRSSDGEFAVVRYEHRDRGGMVVSLRIRSRDGWFSRESAPLVRSTDRGADRTEVSFSARRQVTVYRSNGVVSTFGFDPTTLAVRAQRS